jgi:hypothetical protein
VAARAILLPPPRCPVPLSALVRAAGFDPFWKRVVHHDVFVGCTLRQWLLALHLGVGRQARRCALPTNAMSILNEWRPIQDAVALLGDPGCAVRHPKSRSVSRGRLEMDVPAVDSMAEVYKKAPETLLATDRGEQEPDLLSRSTRRASTT